MRKYKYWYLITEFECPVCFRYYTIRERQYSERPKDWTKRHVFVQDYDWCNEYAF